MKVYISGPMTGLPSHNFPAFNAAADYWRDELGWEVLNPADNAGGDTSLPRSYYMRLDAAALLQADAIALLPGWESSEGAKKELAWAQEFGLDTFDALTGLPNDRARVRLVAYEEDDHGS